MDLYYEPWPRILNFHELQHFLIAYAPVVTKYLGEGARQDSGLSPNHKGVAPKT
jgi:hypothetical protein